MDLALVRPAKGGRISVEDVEAIAERMTQSFRDVPQFSVSCDVDMTAANAARTAAGVSYADVLIWAAARTLHDHPRLAMRYDAEGLIPANGIHLGIAVALGDGLLVPVLRDADTKELAVISRERAALQEGVRAGKLPVDALIGAVFTVSNLGQDGVDRFTAIVNPPEAAILAVGRVRDMAVARDGVVVVAPVMTLTLSVDHRVADGTQAAAVSRRSRGPAHERHAVKRVPLVPGRFRLRKRFPDANISRRSTPRTVGGPRTHDPPGRRRVLAGTSRQGRQPVRRL